MPVAALVYFTLLSFKIKRKVVAALPRHAPCNLLHGRQQVHKLGQRIAELAQLQVAPAARALRPAAEETMLLSAAVPLGLFRSNYNELWFPYILGFAYHLYDVFGFKLWFHD